MREQRALDPRVVGRGGHRHGRRRVVAPRPGRPDRIATARLIPKRGPATEIEIRFRTDGADHEVLENQS